MQDTSANNKRIAKNTLLLYMRTMFTMVIMLYTSRIILDTLGVDDYGIYNVVGGVVAMFAVISGSLSNSISRYITYELGHGDLQKLKTIFSTSINIQIFLSLLILLLGESVGLWFLNEKMNIPPERLYAANWVLHLSILSFIVNLISVPYNAAIIAHEKMSAFAYVSILEVTLKLIIVYLLYISPWDKLIVYSILLVLVSVVIRIVYGIYCSRNFAETHYAMVHDKQLVKEMTSFAWWGFFGNAAWMFNTQGINILINIFFGVGVNAARGIAVQVESALMKFVTDFSTAINPQITKSYASGEMERMIMLVNKGSKFSFFLTLLLSLPLLFETEYILSLWLVEVPAHTATFIRLAIVATMIQKFGDTGYTACMATGTIRKYAIWITIVGCMAFPLTWLAYKMGAPVEATYIIFAFVYVFVNLTRLWLMKGLLKFPVWNYIKEVYGKSIMVAMFSCILPYGVYLYFPVSFSRFIISCVVCIFSTISSIYFVGLTNRERFEITLKVKEVISKVLLFNK